MGVGKVISERNLAEEQWNNGREWQLGIGQGRTETIYIYIYIYRRIDLFSKSQPDGIRITRNNLKIAEIDLSLKLSKSLGSAIVELEGWSWNNFRLEII